MSITVTQARDVEADLDDAMEQRDRFYAVARDDRYARDMRLYAKRKGDALNASICRRQMTFWTDLLESGLTPSDLNEEAR